MPNRFSRSALAALSLAACLAASAAPVRSADYTLGNIKVDHPYAKMTIPGRPAAGYMTVYNAGTEPDAVVSASSPKAERVEFHTHLMEGGVMKMRPVEKVEVPAGGDAAFKPGGFHIMIFGLDDGVKPGDTLPLTVTFEKAGALEIGFPVESVGGKPKSGHSGHGAHKR